MPLELHPAVEADAAKAVAIEKVAYGPNPTGKVLFPGPFPAEDDSRVTLLKTQLNEDKACKWMKVVDPELVAKGEDGMVAFSMWYVWEAPRPKDSFPPRKWGPGTNAEACEMFFGGMIKKWNERLGGKSHICEYFTEP